MNLQEFICNNPVDNITKDVVISKRFTDDVGNVFKFKIKAVTGEQFADYRKQALTINTSDGTTNFNIQKFNELLVLNHCVNPNFRDAGSIDKTKTITPENFMYKTLLAGEISALVEEITALSGFNKTLDDDKKTIKN